MNGGVNRGEALQIEAGLTTAEFRFDTPQLAAGSLIWVWCVMRKSLLVLVCIAGVIIFLVLYSSGTLGPARHEVSCDDFMDSHHISDKAEVALYNTLELELCSNPSTGFQWSKLASIGDESVLEQTDHQYTAPENELDEPPAPGTAGRETWIFKALNEGITTIYLEYSRPLDGDKQIEWTFDLTVLVK